MMYTIELNITDINERLVSAFRGIGANNGFDVFNHGYDRLVFTSERGLHFTNLVRELSMVCEAHGIDYVNLLV